MNNEINQQKAVLENKPSIEEELEKRKGKKAWKKGYIPDENVNVRDSDGERRGSNIVWALMLIFFGGVLLLNTTQLVGWEIWNVLWRFWPILLIIAGMKLIFGRGFISNVIIGLIASMLLAVVLLWSVLVAQPNLIKSLGITIPESVRSRFLLSSDKISDELSVNVADYTGVKRRSIRIDLGAATFNIEDTLEMEKHLNVNADYFENVGVPDLKAVMKADRLVIDFDTLSRRIDFFMPVQSSNYDFIIGGREIPTQMTVVLGAGDGNVNLKYMSLDDLVVEVGAGKINISLENLDSRTFKGVVGQGQMDIDFVNTYFSNKITLDVGAGRIKLRVPETVAYSINYELGLGNINTPSQRLNAPGKGTILSPNYEGATRIFDISVKVGVGQFEIDY